MNFANQSCKSVEDFQMYQHQVYAVVYSLILVPGLLGNVLALWVFKVYVKETKKAVVFMMNLAVADLLQVLSLPLRIYYYLKNTWPFGHFLCMICFYLKRRADWCVCGLGWLLVGLCCLPFPLMRSHGGGGPASNSSSSVCFSELPTRDVGVPAVWALLVLAELLGFIIPLVLVSACTCLTAGSLRGAAAVAVPDRGEKRRALRMVLSCALVFLVCFAPYHVTMPLDFLVKADALGSCALRELVLRCHPVTLCLASLNCSLDPLMYYFTTHEFWRRLGKPERPESISLSRRLSCMTGGGDSEGLGH